MTSLADLQDGFSGAIRRTDPVLPEGISGRNGAGAARRFNVYRNNHIAGLATALEMTFPVVRQLVGDVFFRAAATDYVHGNPPRTPVLLLYGEGFGDFLDELPAAGRFPYLGDMARLEWARTFALHAGDAVPARVQILSRIPEPELSGTRLTLHPSVRTLESRWPVLSIWQDCLSDDGPGKPDMGRTERLLVLRPESEVMTHRLDDGGYTLLHSLAQGFPLGAAAEHAVSRVPDLDLSEQLVLLFEYGAVVETTAVADSKIPPDQGRTRS